MCIRDSYYMGAALHFEKLLEALGIPFLKITDFSPRAEALAACREHLRQFTLPASIDSEDQVKF